MLLFNLVFLLLDLSRRAAEVVSQRHTMLLSQLLFEQWLGRAHVARTASVDLVVVVAFSLFVLPRRSLSFSPLPSSVCLYLPLSCVRFCSLLVTLHHVSNPVVGDRGSQHADAKEATRTRDFRLNLQQTSSSLRHFPRRHPLDAPRLCTARPCHGFRRYAQPSGAGGRWV